MSSMVSRGRARTVFELVGERSRKNVAVQPLLGCLDRTLEAVTLPALGIEEHNPGRLHEQNAQVAFAAFGYHAAGLTRPHNNN